MVDEIIFSDLYLSFNENHFYLSMKFLQNLRVIQEAKYHVYFINYEPMKMQEINI